VIQNNSTLDSSHHSKTKMTYNINFWMIYFEYMGKLNHLLNWKEVYIFGFILV